MCYQTGKTSQISIEHALSASGLEPHPLEDVARVVRGLTLSQGTVQGFWGNDPAIKSQGGVFDVVVELAAELTHGERTEIAEAIRQNTKYGRVTVRQLR